MIHIEDIESRYNPDLRTVTIKLPDLPAPERFVEVDVETATSEKDICQIGIVEVEAGQVIRRCSFFVQPPDNIYDYWCIKVHGITSAKTAEMPSFRDIWKELKPILSMAVIVCHNAPFDLGALNHCMERDGLGDLTVKSVIDTCEELGMIDLFSACSFFGVDMGRHHDASCDAEATARLLLAYSARAGETVTIRKIAEKKFTFAALMKETRNALAEETAETLFTGKTVVLTGIFNFYDRDDLGVRLTMAGAKVTTSVSRKTDYLIAGEFPGESKVAKALALQAEGYQIRVLSEEEMREMLGVD